ncbi:MAG: acyltransferase [Herbaspirillum sp.]|nr:acyltransferase [Herbaspirillum sp.]
MTQKNHFLTLDGFRGLAALLVVMRHTTAFFGSNPFFESYLAVDVFFLLSGAVVTRAYEARLLTGLTLEGFARIRILRLYPLYVLGTGIGIVAAMTGVIWFPHSLPFNAVLGLLFIPSIQSVSLFPFNGPAWSLSAELAVNLFYGATVRMLSDVRVMLLMAASALSILGFLYFGHAHSLDAGFDRHAFYLAYLRVGYSFMAGVLLYRLFARRHDMSAPPIVNNGIAILAMAGLTAILMASPPKAAVPYFDFFAVTIGFPLLVLIGMRYQPGAHLARACKLLGAVSYPIYIVHAPLTEFVRVALRKHAGYSVAAHAPWAGVALLIFLIVLAWCLNRYYDEPVRKFFDGMQSRPIVEQGPAQGQLK